MADKIVVGSGWWGTWEQQPGIKGPTRHPAFFDLWSYFVKKYINPDLISIIDVDSPASPDFSQFDNLTPIQLDRNYGTPSDLKAGRIKTKHCGWSRTVFLSTAYAMACDADVFLYVEQDCLVFGEDFLKRVVPESGDVVLMGRPPTMGNSFSGSGEIVKIAKMPQNSLIVARGAGIQALFNSLIDGDYTDGEHPVEGRMMRNLRGKGLDYLEIPYGRDRPIDFKEPVFYAQDWTKAELNELLALERSKGGTPPEIT